MQEREHERLKREKYKQELDDHRQRNQFGRQLEQRIQQESPEVKDHMRKANMYEDQAEKIKLATKNSSKYADPTTGMLSPLDKLANLHMHKAKVSGR